MKIAKAELNKQVSLIVFCIALCHTTVLEGSSATSHDTNSAKIANDTLILHLIDPNNQPLKGVKVGSWTNWSDTRPAPEQALMHYVRRTNAVTSMEDGIVVLKAKRLFENFSANKTIPLYAYHEDRKIGRLIQVSRKDIGKQIDLMLEPVCHVKGKLTSPGLKTIGQQLKWTNVYVLWNSLRPFKCESNQQHFQFYLPPGQYMLLAYGQGTQDVYLKIKIKTGQRNLELEINLPVDKTALLQGKPAPEFQKVKGWKNGEPITIRELLGKVVLLNFWGYWCHPCIQKMPKLMKLYQEYKDEGLVIIAIHNDSVASIEELDKKLKVISEKYWKGDTLPFLIALDGGGKTPILGTNNNADGVTTAAYGITAYPTVLLIDRQGTLVQKFDVENIRHIAKLEQLLHAKTSSMKKFNKIYCLKKEQILKWIDPSFIKLRKNICNESNRGDQYPYTCFRWSEKLHMTEGKPVFRKKVTLQNILEKVIGLSKFDYCSPDNLLCLEMPGDWIVRVGASKDQQLKALERILQGHTRRSIRFEKRQIERDVIVARGRFNFNPLSGTYNDSWVHVFSDKLDQDESWGGGGGSLDKFLNRLATTQLNQPIINLTESSDRVIFKWGCHKSGYLVRIPDRSENYSKLKLLLANLARQTSLSFSKDRRHVDVWYVVETNKTTRNSSNCSI